MKKKLIFLLIYLFSVFGFAQTTKETQFRNKISLSQQINARWTTDLDLGKNWTKNDYETQNNASYLNQLYARVWGHYQQNDHWRFSSFLGYFYNMNSTDDKQPNFSEIRLALQSIYYFHRPDYVLSSRLRVENKFVENLENQFDATVRLRLQLSFVYPFNGRFVQKGVFYALTSDELFFKLITPNSGSQFFDRNRFSAGFGYAFLNSFKMELSYVNEYIPRPSNTRMENVLQVNLIFSNLIPVVKKKQESKNQN